MIGTGMPAIKNSDKKIDAIIVDFRLAQNVISK